MAAEFAKVHMQKGIKIDGQTRALVIAMGGAIVTSVIAMFIPVSVFESITGATGFSELVPATGAPLGDTARALIAFGFGAIAFAVLAMYLLRQTAKGGDVRPASQNGATAAPAAHDGVSLIDKAKAKITDFVDSRRNPDAVKELSDLPKLRAIDAHPDAPPRRPILAHRDFGEFAGSTPAVEVEAFDVPSTAVVTQQLNEEPSEAAVEDVVELPSAEPAPAEVAEQASAPATVTHMVDRLELAVAERQDQIVKLEALASAEIAKPRLPVHAPFAVEVEALPEPEIETKPEPITPGTRQSIFGQSIAVQPIAAQPVLEVVPSKPVAELVEDDMDAALRSALDTLQRMNARAR